MTLVLAVLPLVALTLAWWLVDERRDVLALGRLSWRGTFVVAFVGVEAVVVLMTELLSVGHHLTPGVTVGSWIFVISVLLATLVSMVGADRLVARVRCMGAAGRWIRRQPPNVMAGLAVLAALFAVLVTVAWIYVPNNNDSLIEHLPRVAHWEQERSVAHFATHELGQIEFAPLHQFNMLHLHLLAGTDRLDGFVQLLGYVVCVVGAAEIARLLGASGAVQVGAAVLCATIPSAVLQATSTQNVLFAAAIGCGLVLLLLSQVRSVPARGPGLLLSALVGGAVGEVALAKGTVVPMLGPVVAFVAYRLIADADAPWRRVIRRLGLPLVVGTLGFAAIAGPFLERNHDLFGSLSGPVSDAHVNDGFSVRAQAGNVIRGVAVHFRVGDAQVGSLDGILQRAMLGALERLDDLIGAPENDPRFNYGGPYEPFATGDYRITQTAEEGSADPWHVVLAVVCGTALVAGARRGRGGLGAANPMAVTLALGLALGFVVFGATTRWFPFMARYHLVLLVPWCPLVAIVLARRRLLTIAAALLVVASLPQLLDHANRSLLHPRRESGIEAYISYGDELGLFVGPSDYEGVTDEIVALGCDRVGIANWVTMEYPLWVGLDLAGWDGEIEHVLVLNESAPLERRDFAPCALVWQTLDRLPHPPMAGWRDAVFGDLTVSSPIDWQAPRPDPG